MELEDYLIMIDRHSANDMLADQLENDFEKALLDVSKRIQKRIQKNPLKTYLKISSDRYTKDEMMAIRIYFEKIGHFKIKFEKPSNDMLIHYTIGWNTTSITTGAISEKNKIFRDKFYIYWGV